MQNTNSIFHTKFIGIHYYNNFFQNISLSNFPENTIYNMDLFINNCRSDNNMINYFKIDKNLTLNINSIKIKQIYRCCIKINNNILLTKINKIQLSSNIFIDDTYKSTIKSDEYMIYHYTSVNKFIITLKYPLVKYHLPLELFQLCKYKQNKMSNYDLYTKNNNKNIIIIRKFNYDKDTKYIIPLLVTLKRNKNNKSYNKLYSFIKKILKLIYICNYYYKNKLCCNSLTTKLVKQCLRNYFR